MKKTKLSLFYSVVSLVLCASMLVGTTFAWFTDGVSTGRNTIAAGNLDVALDYLDAQGNWQIVDENTELFDDAALWEPGYTEVVYLRVRNQGSLALKYQLGVNILSETGSVNVEGKAFMLSDFIYFGTVDDVTERFADRVAARKEVTSPKLISEGHTKEGFMKAGDKPQAMALVVYMPESVGNTANHMTGVAAPSIKLGINLTAAQQAQEADSFDETYDAIAEFAKSTINVSITMPVRGEVENGVLTEAVTLSNPSSGVSVVVPQGVALEDDTDFLTASIVTMPNSGANINLSDGEVTISADVHVAGVAQNNTTPIQVSVEGFLPKGMNLGSLKLYHVEDGATLSMVQTDNPSAHNEFSYDPLTGSTMLSMASFSEVAVVADTNNTWNGQAATAFAGGSGTEDDPFMIASADQLAYFRDQVDAGANFENQFVKLANTIELSGVNFDPIGWGYDYDGYTAGGCTFNGTFDGDHHTIMGLYQSGWDLESTTSTDYTYSMAGGGLFASAVDATFKNVHISGANITMECVDMGILLGYAQGNCTFDHIRIYNSKIANYQRATGGVIGEVSPKRDAEGKPVGTSTHTITDVLVGNNVVVGSLWGDFDAPVGGVIGARWDDDNTTYVIMEDVTVGCRLDVYNDVTSAYKWHAYRRAGMLIGNTDMPAADGRNAKTATADFLTCKTRDGKETVIVELGEWTDYQYCQFSNSNNPGVNYPWVRVQKGENNDAYSNPRYGHPVDANGNTVTNDIHTHKEGDGCRVLIPFAQLYGGGQGVYGATAHPGVLITRPIYTVAYMNGSEVQEVVYVNDNSVPYQLKDAGAGMQWLDREGQPFTQVPAGNTRNIVAHLDDTEKLIAHFLDINGMEIYAEEFQKGSANLEYVPAVPAIEGYIGHWENYDLANATASIVVKPYYTLDENAEELFKLDIEALFTWLTDGKTVVMTQDLSGGQSNASKVDCSVITDNDSDHESRLNLNGYKLEFSYSSNGNKDWHIFTIKYGKALVITGGLTNSGTLSMVLTELNKNSSTHVFEMVPGSKLVMEKGAVVELKYPEGTGDRVSMFYIDYGSNGGETWKPTPDKYPTLQFTDDGTTKRLVALETTIIEVPKTQNTTP